MAAGQLWAVIEELRDAAVESKISREWRATPQSFRGSCGEGNRAMAKNKRK